MTEPHSTSLYIPREGVFFTLHRGQAPHPPTENDLVEIGNCPTLEVEPIVEKAPHYSSRSGLRLKDLDPVVQTEYTLTFECDEIAAGNLARLMMGTLNEQSKVIAGLQNTAAEYYIKFVSDNPIGPNMIFYFWRVSITPNGPLALIGEDYLVQSFTGEGLADTANHAASPYFDGKYLTTTTTTTTTTSTA
jgi:hypothetical protein